MSTYPEDSRSLPHVVVCFCRAEVQQLLEGAERAITPI